MTEDEIAALALQYSDACDGEVGLLYHKIKRWCDRHPGQTPFRTVIFRMCKFMRIEAHRREVGRGEVKRLPPHSLDAEHPSGGTWVERLVWSDPTHPQRTDIDQALNTLTDKQRHIVERMMAGDSLVELAATHNVSKQRIHQIYQQACKRLRFKLAPGNARCYSPMKISNV
jgi:DNA-directed RNA polymerase specialized sigma24 family protein